MYFKRVGRVFFVIFLLILLHACTGSDGKQQDVEFKALPETQEIKPQKPVKIKLKRDTKGEYSWELNSDDVDKVIQIDERLNKSLNKSN